LFSTDQTHLRRYFATLGVAIAAGTLSLAGLFLKLQQELVVPQSTLAALTPTARGALLKRQGYLALGTTLLPWFVLIGFVGGISLSAYGIAGWAKRQRILDEREDIGLHKDQAELRQLSFEENARKLDREAEESVKQGSPSDAPVTTAQVSDVREKYVAIENGLVRKLAEAFDNSIVQSASVLRSSHIPKVEVDAVLRLPERDPILFEIKYSSHYASAERVVHDGVRQLAYVADKAKGKGVFVLILSDDFPLMEMERLKLQAERLAAEYSSIATVYTDTYSHFLDLPPKVFVHHVFPGN
jgi:hypothetical protein